MKNPGSGKSFDKYADKMLKGNWFKNGISANQVFELIMNKDGIEMTMPDNVGSDAGQERREKQKLFIQLKEKIFS